MIDKPPQRPYDQALQRGLVTLSSQHPSAERLQSLGASMTDRIIRIPALKRQLSIDLNQHQVRVDGAGSARSV